MSTPEEDFAENMLVAVGKAADAEITNEERLETAQLLANTADMLDTGIPTIKTMLKNGVSPAGVLRVVLSLTPDHNKISAGACYSMMIELAQRGWLEDEKTS